MYVCVYIYIYICTYNIYIYRERERESPGRLSGNSPGKKITHQKRQG